MCDPQLPYDTTTICDPQLAADTATICVRAHTTSPVGLSWTAEMFGYVFAASELGIRHEVRSLLALLVQKYKY